MDDLISRTWLLSEYDKRHKGPPGGARKLIEEAPPALGTNLAEVGTDCSEFPNNSDAISRQAAVDICANAIDLWHGQIGEGALVAVRDKIAELTPAEPKEGRWIEISSITHTYKCSVCGRLLVNVADGRNNVSKHYPYCHCGADMRGEP